MNENFVGFEEVKEIIIEQTLIANSGLRTEPGPRVNIFLSGAKGAGKTEIAKAYAQAMGLPYRRIEMNLYSGSLGAEDLLYEIGSTLKKNAFTVLCFDEVEKASPEAQNALLGLLDRDHISVLETLNSTGRSRNFIDIKTSNASVFFTGNAGHKSSAFSQILIPGIPNADSDLVLLILGQEIESSSAESFIFEMEQAGNIIPNETSQLIVKNMLMAFIHFRH